MKERRKEGDTQREKRRKRKKERVKKEISTHKIQYTYNPRKKDMEKKNLNENIITISYFNLIE
jgi:hypothetical protein